MQTPEFQEKVRWDHVIYQAANRSLDLTIDELGRDNFYHYLVKYRQAQKAVQEKCDVPGIFPCTSDGSATPRKENGCLWNDAGCNFYYLDKVAAELDLWKPI